MKKLKLGLDVVSLILSGIALVVVLHMAIRAMYDGQLLIGVFVELLLFVLVQALMIDLATQFHLKQDVWYALALMVYAGLAYLITPYVWVALSWAVIGACARMIWKMEYAEQDPMEEKLDLVLWQIFYRKAPFSARFPATSGVLGWYLTILGLVIVMAVLMNVIGWVMSLLK